MEKTSNFLPAATSFEGFPLKEKPFNYAPTVLCPLCKGHGGWNLRLNEYGPGKHFDAHCMQCAGWGWVRADSTDATCIHEDREVSRPANHRSGWHETECKKCGRKSGYDTSD